MYIFLYNCIEYITILWIEIFYWEILVWIFVYLLVVPCYLDHKWANLDPRKSLADEQKPGSSIITNGVG